MQLYSHSWHAWHRRAFQFSIVRLYDERSDEFLDRSSWQVFIVGPKPLLTPSHPNKPALCPSLGVPESNLNQVEPTHSSTLSRLLHREIELSRTQYHTITARRQKRQFCILFCETIYKRRAHLILGPASESPLWATRARLCDSVPAVALG
jgi:hypothetical protein